VESPTLASLSLGFLGLFSVVFFFVVVVLFFVFFLFACGCCFCCVQFFLKDGAELCSVGGSPTPTLVDGEDSTVVEFN
jgi:hypothetical protein